MCVLLPLSSYSPSSTWTKFSISYTLREKVAYAICKLSGKVLNRSSLNLRLGPPVVIRETGQRCGVCITIKQCPILRALDEIRSKWIEALWPLSIGMLGINWDLRWFAQDRCWWAIWRMTQILSRCIVSTTLDASWFEAPQPSNVCVRGWYQIWVAKVVQGCIRCKDFCYSWADLWSYWCYKVILDTTDDNRKISVGTWGHTRSAMQLLNVQLRLWISILYRTVGPCYAYLQFCFDNDLLLLEAMLALCVNRWMDSRWIVGNQIITWFPICKHSSGIEDITSYICDYTTQSGAKWRKNTAA